MPVAGAGGTTTASTPAPQARARALLQLARLLQLHVLGDPAAAPDTSLLLSLRKVRATSGPPR